MSVIQARYRCVATWQSAQSGGAPRFEARLLPEDNQEQFRDGKPQGAFSLGSLKEQVFKQGGIYDVNVTLLEEPEEPEAATE